LRSLYSLYRSPRSRRTTSRYASNASRRRRRVTRPTRRASRATRIVSRRAFASRAASAARWSAASRARRAADSAAARAHSKNAVASLFPRNRSVARRASRRAVADARAYAPHLANASAVASTTRRNAIFSTRRREMVASSAANRHAETYENARRKSLLFSNRVDRSATTRARRSSRADARHAKNTTRRVVIPDRLRAAWTHFARNVSASKIRSDASRHARYVAETRRRRKTRSASAHVDLPIARLVTYRFQRVIARSCACARLVFWNMDHIFEPSRRERSASRRSDVTRARTVAGCVEYRHAEKYENARRQRIRTAARRARASSPRSRRARADTSRQPRVARVATRRANVRVAARSARASLRRSRFSDVVHRRQSENARDTSRRRTRL